MTARSSCRFPGSRAFILFALAMLANGLPGLVPLARAEIQNIKTFLDQCPTNDPAYARIRSDFTSYRNGVPVGAIHCSEPVSSMPVAQYTLELAIVQTLRVAYYMDLGRSSYLPWTPLRYYDWLKSKVGGIAVTEAQSTYCCSQFEAGRYAIGLARIFQDEFQREYLRSFQGISGLIALIGHEARHMDNFPHTSGCGNTGACDLTYDESNLSPYGIQYWLFAHFLSGDINVGVGCLPTTMQTSAPFPATSSAIGQWLVDGGNNYQWTFEQTLPPLLTMPVNPGGLCTFALAPGASQGLWWNPDQSGWGINFSHQGDIIFATWFTYDAKGKPWWLIAVLNKKAARTYSGPVSTVTGPPFNAAPFQPPPLEVEIGTMTATFGDAMHATIAYTVGGISQSKAIVPQQFGALPACSWGGQPNLALATNYTGLWWNAAESGWGVNFTHQGDIVFATWFTYDGQGKPWWLIAVLSRTADGVYGGPVSTVAGPLFASAPFGPPPLETEVGTMTATFADGNAATLAYTVNSTSQTKAITRQVFVPPGTVCH